MTNKINEESKMNYYFIDYENIHSEGFSLTDRSTVRMTSVFFKIKYVEE